MPETQNPDHQTLGRSRDDGAWLTKEGAAQHLQVSTRTVQRWISSGELTAYKSGRLLRVRRTDLDQLLASDTGAIVEGQTTETLIPTSSTSGPGADDPPDDSDCHLGAQAREAGILRIFKSRVEDPDYKSALKEALKGVEAGQTVEIMSNSLRSLFGHQVDPQLIMPVNNALKRDVKFRILLLDPTSPAAKRRAAVEEQDRPSAYDKTHLYLDIMEVAQTLKEPVRIRDPELRRRLSDRDQVEVRFSGADPSTHLIVTNTVTFVENYHTGGNSRIQERLAEEGLPNIYCYGGFVTVFMYDGASLTAELMKSHFVNVWEKSKEPTLDAVLARQGDAAITSWDIDAG